MIRKANISDFKKIHSFATSLLDQHKSVRPDIFCDGEALTLDEYKMMLEDGSMITLVYESNDEVMGFINARIFTYDNPLLRKIRSCHINDLYVEEKHRQKGIAKKLIEKLSDHLKELHVQKIELRVWSFNKSAIKFYSELGFDIEYLEMEKCLK